MSNMLGAASRLNNVGRRLTAAAARVTSCRFYNATIDPGSTKVINTTSPREKFPYEKLVFGRSFSDHMLEIDWDEKNGWHAPVIKPYGDLALSPAATSLHYGIEVRLMTPHRTKTMDFIHSDLSF